MKIAHLSTYGALGGAAKVAYALHRALSQKLVSELWVAQKDIDDASVFAVANKLSFKIKKRLERLLLSFYPHKEAGYPFSSALFGTSLERRLQGFQPGLLHLHWTNGGFLRLEQISSFKMPLVWTLHDAWPFTGGCHILGDCERYAAGCGQCPTLGSPETNDLSHRVWQRKEKVFSSKKIHIVAVSQWMAEKARKSPLFKSFPISVIPNALDTKVFTRTDPAVAKKALGLSAEKIILFGAFSAVTDPNKGFSYLVEALEELKTSNAELVVFGADSFPGDLGFPVKFMGQIKDDATLAQLYSVADVTVVPSLQESFGMTALESLACGTPVVCFDSSGLKEIVSEPTDGYRAKCYDAKDLAVGIEKFLSVKDGAEAQRRKKVEARFSLEIQRDAYIRLYESILSSKQEQRL